MVESKITEVSSTEFRTVHVEKAPNVTVQEHSEDESNGHLQPMLHGQPQLLPGHSPTITFDSDPRHLAEDWKWELFFDVYDSFLIVITLVLLAKTSLCIYAWNRDKAARGLYLDTVSSLTLNLIRFNEQLVTAFTIIFVTIMTTVTRRYALFKAQKGAYIADIEQLQASISLPSTIKMVFSLQRFTKVSIILVALWSFYYTGSQASKREYELTIADKDHPIVARYPRTNAAIFVDLESELWPGGAPSDFPTILKRAGGDKVVQTGSDEDGNILLPDPNYVDALNMNGTVSNPHSIDIKSSSKISYLTPPVGRPLFIEVQYKDENGTLEPQKYWQSPRVVGDYQLQTSYTKFHCLSVDVVSAKDIPAGALSSMPISMNVTQPTSSSESGAAQLQLYYKWTTNDSYINDAGELVDRPNINGTGGGAFRFTCDILEPEVFVNVHCGEASCLVKKMFYPQLSNKTLADSPFANATFAQSLFSSMLFSAGVPPSLFGALGSNVITNQLMYRVEANMNISEPLALRMLSVNIDTLVNGYLNLVLRAGLDPMLFSDNFDAAFDKVALKGAAWDPHYQIFWEWIAIDYVAGLCLLGAAIFSFWLRRNTIAPDIFGFVSSLTRDNPHFPVPVGGSTLDGISRTRAFRNVKVKLGDIGADADGHGRLGFVPVLATTPAATLSRHRKYI